MDGSGPQAMGYWVRRGWFWCEFGFCSKQGGSGNPWLDVGPECIRELECSAGLSVIFFSPVIYTIPRTIIPFSIILVTFNTLLMTVVKLSSVRANNGRNIVIISFMWRFVWQLTSRSWLCPYKTCKGIQRFSTLYWSRVRASRRLDSYYLSMMHSLTLCSDGTPMLVTYRFFWARQYGNPRARVDSRHL